MKKSMKKFIVACAAVSAITVAAGISAMAAEYTEADNSVKFTVPAGDADSQKTVLVIPKDKKGSVKDEDILYIDQDAALKDTALLKGTELPKGDYLVMVGYYNNNTFTISEEVFNVGGGGDVPPVVEYTLGDVNDDGVIDPADALLVLKYYIGEDLTETQQLAADVTKDELIDPADALQILKYYVGDIDNF